MSVHLHPNSFACMTAVFLPLFLSWQAVVATRVVGQRARLLHHPTPCTRRKKISKQRSKASAAKWLIGFYGNWLLSTPAAYPTVPLSPYF